jgi:hypothetical protein
MKALRSRILYGVLLVGATILWMTSAANTDTYPAEWNGMDLGKVVARAQECSNDPNRSDECKQLGNYFASEFAEYGKLSGTNQTKWLSAAKLLGGNLDKSSKATLAKSLSDAIVVKGTLQSLELSRLHLAVAAWDSLGKPKESVRACVEWTKASDAYKSLDAGSLAVLTGVMVRYGHLDKAIRKDIFDHVGHKWFSDASKARSEGIPALSRLIAHIKPRLHLSSEQKSVWAETVRAAFLENGVPRDTVKEAEMDGLLYVLRKLGDKSVKKIWVARVEKSEDWKDWSSAELVGLARKLSGSGEAGKESRAAVARQIKKKCLSEQSFKLMQKGPGAWREIRKMIGQDLPASEAQVWESAFQSKMNSEVAAALSSQKIDLSRTCKWLEFGGAITSTETKKQWSQVLASRYTGDALKVLEWDDVCQLAATLAKLGTSEAQSLKIDWVESSEGWKSWSSQRLLGLAKEMAETGDSGKSARAEISRQIRASSLQAEGGLTRYSVSEWREARSVAEKCLPTDEAAEWKYAFQSKMTSEIAGMLQAEKIDLSTMCNWLRYAASQVEPSTRTQWLSSLSSRFSGEAMKDLGWRDVRRLVSTVQELGSESPGLIKVRWVESSEAWKSWSADRILELAEDLSEVGEAGRVARAAVTRQLKKTSLGEGVGKLTDRRVSDWARVHNSTQKVLSDSESEAWKQAFRSKMSAELDAMLQAEKVDLSSLFAWLSYGAGEVDADTKSRWLTALSNRYSGTALGSLKWKTVGKLASTLAKLGAEKPDAVKAGWVESAAAWKSWDVHSRLKLITQLRKIGITGRSARAALLSHLRSATFSGSKPAVTTCRQNLWDDVRTVVKNEMHSVASEAWESAFQGKVQAEVTGMLNSSEPDIKDICKWTEYAIPEAAESTREQWRGMVLQRFTGKSGKARSFADISRVAALLGRLNHKSPADVVAVWSKSASIKTMKDSDVVRLASWLDRTGFSQREARKAFAARVKARYIDQADPNLPDHDDMRGILSSCAGDLPGNQRQQWGAELARRYGLETDQSIKQKDANSLCAIANTIEVLNRGQAAILASRWFRIKGRAGLDGQSPKALIGLASCAMATPGIRDDLDRKQLAVHLDEVLVPAHQANVLPQWACDSLARSFKGHDGERSQAWAMRAYRVVLKPGRVPSISEIGSLGHLMNDVGLVGKGQGYRDFAKALVAMAKKGKLGMTATWRLGGKGWQVRKLAYPLAAPETRSILQAELVDSNGNVRIEVGYILGWAYRKNEQLEDWIAFVNEKLADSSLTPDQKSQWLVVKGHASSLIPVPAKLGAAVPHMTRALTTARSDAARITVLNHLTAVLYRLDRFQQGISVISSVREQFSGADRTRVDKLLAVLEQGRQEQVAQRAEIAASQKAAGKRAKLRYLRKMLARAHAVGNSRKAAEMTQKIEDLRDAISE